MLTRSKAALASAAMAIILTACGGAEEVNPSPNEPSSSAPKAEDVVLNDPEQPKDVSYSTITEFRDALIAAEIYCPGYSPRAEATYAAAMADCDEETVLAIFSSTTQRDEQVRVLKETALEGTDQPLLVGPNWVLNSNITVLRQAQNEIGGILDESDPRPAVASAPEPESAPTGDSTFSAEDTRYIQVLALTMTLNDSPGKQDLCDGYDQIGADLTATVLNSEVSEENRFPVDVVEEVFEANC